MSDHPHIHRPEVTSNWDVLLRVVKCQQDGLSPKEAAENLGVQYVNAALVDILYQMGATMFQKLEDAQRRNASTG